MIVEFVVENIKNKRQMTSFLNKINRCPHCNCRLMKFRLINFQYNRNDQEAVGAFDISILEKLMAQERLYSVLGCSHHGKGNLTYLKSIHHGK